MKNVFAHSATSPAIWLVNPFTDWKANLVSAIQNGTRALFVCAALIVVLAFALPLAAQGQNNSANPYINSTHLYRVPMGNTANSVTWELFDNLAEAADYTLNGTQSWAIAAKVGSNAEIVIYFDDAVFTTGQTWYLVYSEMNGSNCEAKRSVTINPVENTFYFSMGADDSDCHPLDGEVLNWNDVDDEKPEVSLGFTVKLNKTGNYKINSYTFVGEISFTDSKYSLVGIDVTGATVNVNTATGKFDVTLTNAPYDALNTGLITPFEIAMNVRVSGLVYEGDVVKVTLTGGSATSGTNYTVVTDVDDPPPNPTKQDQQLTILPLPATSNIAIVE